MASSRPEAIATPPRKRAAWTLAWLLLAAVVLTFLWMTWRKYGQPDPEVYSIFWSRRGWLWAHLVGGAATLLLGPFQFIAPLRNGYPRIHRWTGRLYLLAMAVACVGAAGLIATTPGGLGLQVAFSATEIAWLFTATMGYLAIRKRRLQEHRRWMIRNYLVTMVFVTFRATIMIPGVMSLAPPNVVIPTLLWLGWAVPVVIYEVGWRTINRMRRD